MKKIRQTILYSVICALMLSVFAFSAPTAQAVSDPDVLAASAILIEANTSTVLYAKDETARRAPASLSKVMTVMLAVEACDRGEISPDDVVTAGSNIYRDVTSDASTQNIKTGEKMTFNDLLHCALIASANEACNFIAEVICGDIDTFIQLMNTRAAELGCTDTHFANTHGLPNENHYTTAKDLALIAASAMDNPLFSDIASTQKYQVAKTNKSAVRKLVNTNKLILENNEYYYEYATGLKTGYTDAAGYCLMSSAEKDELSLICIVLGAESVVQSNGSTLTRSFSESKRLLQWGFDNFSYRTVISSIDLIADVPVALGDGIDSVIVRPHGEIRALLANDVKIDDFTFETVIYAHENSGELKAPISEGDKLGEVTVSLNGVSYGTLPLVANASVAVRRSEFVKAEIAAFFSNTYVIIAIVILLIFAGLYVWFVINYNKKRRAKHKEDIARARQKSDEQRRNTVSTVGRSFEEIERIHARKDQYK